MPARLRVNAAAGDVRFSLHWRERAEGGARFRQ
jgi:hypothetical protein